MELEVIDRYSSACLTLEHNPIDDGVGNSWMSPRPLFVDHSTYEHRVFADVRCDYGRGAVVALVVDSRSADSSYKTYDYLWLCG